MAAMGNTPALERERVRKLRGVWHKAWSDRSDVPLKRVLVGLEAALEKGRKAARVPGDSEKGYPAIYIALEIPTSPVDVQRPLELVQALHWNADIIERTIESLVIDCRRRGYSWADIATALDVARQTAWAKYASIESDTSEVTA